MPNFRQGPYTVKNAAKYVGKGTPKYRSGWELTFMMFLDSNDNVLQWASESIHINYKNPFTNKATIYVPDFFIVYVDKSGAKRAELIEIKPSTQSTLESAKSVKDQAAAVLNMYKWQAAQAWCKSQGITFRVVTENDIFHQGNGR